MLQTPHGYLGWKAKLVEIIHTKDSAEKTNSLRIQLLNDPRVPSELVWRGDVNAKADAGKRKLDLSRSGANSKKYSLDFVMLISQCTVCSRKQS